MNAALKSSLRTQNGVVLPTVLWLVVLVTGLALHLTYKQKIYHSILFNDVRAQQHQFHSEGGISSAVYYLLTHRSTIANKASHEISQDIDGQKTNITIVDEAGKININYAEPRIILNLFSHLLKDEMLAKKLTDATLDWRDPDDIPRAFGAEQTLYSPGSRYSHIRNGPFRNIEELMAVIGFNKTIYEQIKPFVTTYTKHPGVSLYSASIDTLMALPTMTISTAEEIVAIREAEGNRLLARLSGDIRKYMSSDINRVFSISTVTENSNIAYECVISLANTQQLYLTHRCHSALTAPSPST